MSKSLVHDLDAILQRQKAIKVASTKKASPGDGVEDGTKKPETGEQMASNKEHAGTYSAAMVDSGAKSNAQGGSLERSTDGATAANPDGKSGSKGADLDVQGKAPNGPEDTKSKAEGGRDNGMDSALKTAGDLAAALRKAAAALDVKPEAKPETKPEVKTEPKSEKTAATKESEVNAEKNNLSGLECFLVKAARSNPQVKISAAAPGGAGAPGADAGAPPAAGGAPGMDDHAMAGNIVDQLIQAIESGQMSEEDAEKMLMEGVQQGAISEQDLMQAMQALHQPGAPGDDQGGAAAAGGPGPDAGAGAPPAGAGAPMPPPGPAAGGADAGGAPDMTQAKMAAAHIDENHPEYLAKLDALYDADVRLGYAACVKLAEDLAAEADAGNDHDADDKPADKTDAPPAHHEPKHEGPVHDEAVLSPHDPAQQQALLQLLADMGITPEDLQQLMAQKHGAPAGMDPKIAEYREHAMTAILHKIAQAQLAHVATSGKK